MLDADERPGSEGRRTTAAGKGSFETSCLSIGIDAVGDADGDDVAGIWASLTTTGLGLGLDIVLAVGGVRAGDVRVD